MKIMIKTESQLISLIRDIIKEFELHQFNVMNLKNKVYTMLESLQIEEDYRYEIINKLNQYKSHHNILLSLSKDKQDFSVFIG